MKYKRHGADDCPVCFNSSRSDAEPSVRSVRRIVGLLGVAGTSTLVWLGLIVPFVVFLTVLVVYYLWEGRRERNLRAKYGGDDGG